MAQISLCNDTDSACCESDLELYTKEYNIKKMRTETDPSYTQAFQISVPLIRERIPTEDLYEDGVVEVNMSTEKDEYYIYMSEDQREYIFKPSPIKPSTFQHLLDHILYTTPIFIDFYKKGIRFDFKLLDNPEDSEAFMSKPLYTIKPTQGTIVEKTQTFYM